MGKVENQTENLADMLEDSQDVVSDNADGMSSISDEEIEKFSEILLKITENLSEDGLSEKEVLDFISKEKERKGDDN